MELEKHDSRFAFLLKLPMYLWSILFVLVAMLYVIGLSFLTRGEVVGVTSEITFANYLRLAAPEYWSVLEKSLKQLLLELKIVFIEILH